MIVTRTWLEEFVDLEGITNDTLYKTFNAIGLEVDSFKTHTIPEKVVVGRIVACGKHPDADKLSLCSIDIGTGELQQIICGAANVVDAEYVAVATIGAVLPGDFKIKPAKLRGVESFGMVCSSKELGLPEMGDGIMILDESIGELEIGRELNSYPKVADTVIELELTANRGDCLSIHGVARDLSAAFDRPMFPIKLNKNLTTKTGMARQVTVRSDRDVPVDLLFILAENDELGSTFLTQLRLAFVALTPEGSMASLVRYATHATGVILHAYDAKPLRENSGMIALDVHHGKQGLVTLSSNDRVLSAIGINHNDAHAAGDDVREVLFVASYIEPNLLVETVATQKLKTDTLYYNTSRGSEPQLSLGAVYFRNMYSSVSQCRFYEGDLTVLARRHDRMLSVSVDVLSAIVGNPLSKTVVYKVLDRLGFTMRGGMAETFAVRIPPHRHDIVNIQDVAEEVLRMRGIDNIEAKPLVMTEHNRMNDATRRYRFKRDLRQRAVASGFYEAVTYAFAARPTLVDYGFPTVEAPLDVVNPIVEELNTLRTTLTVNILEALKRNVSYGIKRIPLFEIGAVFDAKRQQTERILFAWSGHKERESVVNHGKPPAVTFVDFIEKLGHVIGAFGLVECEEDNALIHPYQSATLRQHGRAIGYVTKLHPTVAQAYDLGETFIAELDLDALLPRHTLVRPVSNFQGVHKDISVLVAGDMPYQAMHRAVASVDIPLLRRLYVVDVYEDESLKGRKSVTVRLFVQSSTETLTEKAIDETVEAVLKSLENQCQATLR